VSQLYQRVRGADGRIGPAEAVLAGLLAAALALRLWSIDHGLPFVFNPDEAEHFVTPAVGMFDGSLNPGYFDNPPALTYLLHATLRIFEALGGEALAAAGRPSEAAFLTGRLVVALLGTLVVALVYWAGTRFFERRVGLVAAALLAFSFLPVFYSKQALNDVVTLVPLTVGLVGCLLAYERGRPLDWALAGAALGAAAATKYTAGAMAITVALAALLRVSDRRSALVPAVLGLAGAGVAFTVAFLVLHPYSVLDFASFREAVADQSGTAGGRQKLGQEDVPGPVYYLWTLTWGLGWLPAVAALAGAVLALRRDLRRGLLLVFFPLLLLGFLSLQARYFGRWYMPAYPALAILAGYAVVRLADAVPLSRAALRPALLALLAVLLVGQGLASSVRSSALLAEDDTRALAREWIRAGVPAGSRVAAEPFLPEGFLDGYRIRPVERPFDIYERRLGPELVDSYAREGYCWVVVGSYQKERGLAAGLANARAYYARLDDASIETLRFSPYRLGAGPVDFNFDLSFNFLPRAYERPGPVVEVHRLAGCG